jgi:hypothetical protein
MNINEYFAQGMKRPSFKDELETSIKGKLRDLGSFPKCITPELQNEIQDLQNKFLELRQEGRFTVIKGVEMQKQIDLIYKNRAIACQPKIATDEEEEADEEDRRRKPAHPKSKRKVCRCKK